MAYSIPEHLLRPGHVVSADIIQTHGAGAGGKEELPDHRIIFTGTGGQFQGLADTGKAGLSIVIRQNLSGELLYDFQFGQSTFLILATTFLLYVNALLCHILTTYHIIVCVLFFVNIMIFFASS